MSNIYSEKLEKTDVTNPESVLNTIIEFTNLDVSVEQRLFGIGLVINKNKENYINSLKNDITSKNKEIDTLRLQVSKLKKENKELKKPIPQPEPPKKKIVILKKK